MNKKVTLLAFFIIGTLLLKIYYFDRKSKHLGKVEIPIINNIVTKDFTMPYAGKVHLFVQQIDPESQDQHQADPIKNKGRRQVELMRKLDKTCRETADKLEWPQKEVTIKSSDGVVSNELIDPETGELTRRGHSQLSLERRFIQRWCVSEGLYGPTTVSILSEDNTVLETRKYTHGRKSSSFTIGFRTVFQAKEKLTFQFETAHYDQNEVLLPRPFDHTLKFRRSK